MTSHGPPQATPILDQLAGLAHRVQLLSRLAGAAAIGSLGAAALIGYYGSHVLGKLETVDELRAKLEDAQKDNHADMAAMLRETSGAWSCFRLL